MNGLAWASIGTTIGLAGIAFPVRGDDQSQRDDTVGMPTAEELEQRVAAVKNAYSRSQWTIRQITDGPVTRRRVSFNGTLAKTEKLESQSDNPRNVHVLGAQIEFRAQKGKANGFVLSGAAPRNPAATSDANFFNEIRPLCEAWAWDFDFRGNSLGNALTVERVARDGATVVRVSFRPPEPQRHCVFDFRPDLGWVVDRRESAYEAGVGKDAKLCKMIVFSTYEGKFRGVGIIRSSRLLVSVASDPTPTELDHHEIEAFEAEALPEAEFVPEAYGIPFSSPKSNWWRWVAGIVGALGVIAGFWWLRRKAAAS